MSIPEDMSRAEVEHLLALDISELAGSSRADTPQARDAIKTGFPRRVMVARWREMQNHQDLDQRGLALCRCTLMVLRPELAGAHDLLFCLPSELARYTVFFVVAFAAQGLPREAQSNADLMWQHLNSQDLEDLWGGLLKALGQTPVVEALL